MIVIMGVEMEECVVVEVEECVEVVSYMEEGERSLTQCSALLAYEPSSVINCFVCSSSARSEARRGKTD